MNKYTPLYNKSEFIKSIILGLISGIFLVTILKNLQQEHSLILSLVDHWYLVILFVCSCLAVWVYGFYFFASKWPTAMQFGKFIAVGQSNAAIDIGILNLLILITDIDSGLYYSLFKATSFIFAVVNSFMWNKFWSFDSKEKDGMGRQFVIFIAVSLVGLIINVSVASFVVNYIGPQWGISTKLWANVGVLSSTIFNIIWDFYGYKRFVFKK
ncbi:MAG TPA: GtrA family protein [Thermodesulfobacteriota bacterium]|nr:GtrA family protein [Thermodesulfobacteriota bacterium]